MMLVRRLQGKTLAEIAKEFQLTLSSTTAIISDAKKSELIGKSKDILSGMIPKALAVVDASLTAGDKDIALEVLKAVGVIGKPWEFPNVTGEVTDSFELFRARITRKAQGVSSGAARTDEGRSDIIDVTAVATATSEESGGPPDRAGEGSVGSD